MKNRYNHLNEYLKNKFGERVLKVCVDGGFTCPNRDGKCGTGGCIFCSEYGAGENIKYKEDNIKESIRSQINKFLDSYRGDRANKFICYFQAFTNTYDSVQNLKSKYDFALAQSDKFVGLQIATRPDCVSDDVVKLLASYKEKYYVCVELGFQTANDNVGSLINRGYTTNDFIQACNLLHKYGIDVVAHVMIGLPNETKTDIIDTIQIINKCKCSGVKIHSTYVVKNTKLEKMYLNGLYKPIEQEYYVEMVGDIISRLNKDIIVHRINADPNKEFLVEPKWTTRKKVVLNGINKYLEENNIMQGEKNE
jgi:radical SAM protein (TIGR01212 family)